MLVANMQILAGHQKPPYVFKSQIRKTDDFNTHTDCYMQGNLVCSKNRNIKREIPDFMSNEHFPFFFTFLPQ